VWRAAALMAQLRIYRHQFFLDTARDFAQLRDVAKAKVSASRAHFSVSAFRALLQESKLTRSDRASEGAGTALSGPCLPRASVRS
jgi:hypothetical protein